MSTSSRLSSLVYLSHTLDQESMLRLTGLWHIPYQSEIFHNPLLCVAEKLAHRLRRWPNINSTLCQCRSFAGKCDHSAISGTRRNMQPAMPGPWGIWHAAASYARP